jgi:carbon monoxide dehydrogenase subunit G
VHLTYRLTLPPDVAFRWLAEPERFVRVHPLITEMTPTGPGGYRVRERVARGPLPLHFTYPAWIEVDEEERVVQVRVRIWRLIRSTMVFRVLQDGQGSRIEEEVELRAPPLVGRLLEQVFREEHGKLFRTLEAVASLESRRAATDGEPPHPDGPGGV